jgi:hypothetical protein
VLWRPSHTRRPSHSGRATLRLIRDRHLIRTMSRKPDVPSIPDKRTARTKPVKAKAAPDPRPPEQFDLWGALADFGESGEPTEAAVPRPAKISRRRSRTA